MPVIKREKLTVLHLLNSPPSIFMASMTIRPAMTAFVVAMAGIMFPAIAGEREKIDNMYINYCAVVVLIHS